MQRLWDNTMKPITRIFLIFQLLDIIITYFAYASGLVWEANPLGFSLAVVLLKVAGIIFVCHLLEKITYKSKLILIVPTTSVMVVIWNLVVIGLEIL